MVPPVQQWVSLGRKAQDSNNCSVLESGCQDPEEVGSNANEGMPQQQDFELAGQNEEKQAEKQKFPSPASSIKAFM